VCEDRKLFFVVKQSIKTRRSCFFEKLYLLNVSIFADIEKMTNLKRQIKCAYLKKLTNYICITTRNTRTKKLNIRKINSSKII